MRILIQRVSSASVTVEGEIIGKVGQGICSFYSASKQKITMMISITRQGK